MPANIYARGADAILFVLRTGAPWRLPPDAPPPDQVRGRLWQTAYRWFARLWDQGFFQTLNHALLVEGKIMGRQRHARVDIDARAPELLVGMFRACPELDPGTATVRCRCSSNPAADTRSSSTPLPTAATTRTLVADTTPIRIEIVRKIAGRITPGAGSSAKLAM